MLLNFDLTATAFVEEGPVLSFAQDILRVPREVRSQRPARATQLIRVVGFMHDTAVLRPIAIAQKRADAP